MLVDKCVGRPLGWEVTPYVFTRCRQYFCVYFSGGWAGSIWLSSMHALSLYEHSINGGQKNYWYIITNSSRILTETTV